MTVFVNNEKREFASELSVLSLLRDVSLEGKKGIAVAVNNAVVPKNSWDDFRLEENDRVTIIRATQGG